MQALLGRHLHEHVGAAPLLGNDAVLHQLLTHAVGIRARLVDLVDGHHDGHLGRLRVVDGLDGLRHDAVVGGHHQHDNVGDLGAAGAHGRERLVARRVDERDLLAVDLHHRRADMLGDAAGLAGHDARVADGVQKRRLAVVDVAHDGDHGRAGLEVLVLVVVHHRILLLRRHDAHLAAHVVGDELDQLVAHGLRQGEHLAQHEQALDDVVGLHAQDLGEFRHRGSLGDLHDGIVEHQRGIEALLDGLQLHALAVLGLALLLALLTAAFALMRGRGGDGGTSLCQHLVALQLLGLHGHLRVAVLGLGCLLLELGHDLLDVPAPLALLGRTLGLGALARGVAGGGSSLLLRLDALLLGLDLRQQRVERRLLGAQHRRGPLRRRRARSALGALRVAVAQRLFHRLLLGHLCSHLGLAGAGAGLGSLAGHAFLLALDLARQALERRGNGRLLRAAFSVGALRAPVVGRAFGSLGALGLAGGALLLHRFATGALLLGLFALGLGALFGQLPGLLVLQLPGALLDLGLQVLADLVDVGVREHARMALRGDLHLLQLVEQLFARHIEFLRQLMYSHAGHIPLLYFCLASRAAKATSAAILSYSSLPSVALSARSSFFFLHAAAKHSSEQTYAPLPGARPVLSNDTAPDGSRTMRMSSALPASFPHAMQLRWRTVLVVVIPGRPLSLPLPYASSRSACTPQ